MVIGRRNHRESEMEAIQQAVQTSIADNYWKQLGDKKAPPGKLRLMHIDPRDHEAVHRGDYDSADDVRAILDGMLYAQREVMAVYNDKDEYVAS